MGDQIRAGGLDSSDLVEFLLKLDSLGPRRKQKAVTTQKEESEESDSISPRESIFVNME